MINKDPKRLPKAIWFFRDGIADGQIREMNSKEVVGIQRGLREFARKHKIKAEDGKMWTPKVMFIVVQKHILDRFGEVTQGGSLRPPKKAAVLYDYVLSIRLWDFIAWYNVRGKNRPLRYIVIKDDLKLAAKGGAVDLFQFCYALCFTYCYSAPFPLGNPNQPSPVKYAKHFAENIAQQILTTDISFDSFRTNRNLNRPHLCIFDAENRQEMAGSVLSSRTPSVASRGTVLTAGSGSKGRQRISSGPSSVVSGRMGGGSPMQRGMVPQGPPMNGNGAMQSRNFRQGPPPPGYPQTMGVGVHGDPKRMAQQG